MAFGSRNSDVDWPSYAVLIASVLALALVLYGALRFPLSIANGGMNPFLAAVIGLVAYAFAATWLQRSASEDTRMALRVGAVAGGAIAGCAIVNHIVELWTTLPASVGSLLGAGMWGLMFLGFGVTCTTMLSRHRSLANALLASTWCAMVMAVLLIVVALGIGFLFLPHMQVVLAAPFASSGMTDPEAFVAGHLISSASSHLFIAPSIAVIVGAFSAVAFIVFAPLSRRSSILLGCVGIMLFLAGVMAIRHASELAREDRPPFIDFGLASLAITLISAHPLMLAMQRGSRRSAD